MAKSHLLLFDVDGVIMDSFEQIYSDTLKFVEHRGGQGFDQEEFRAMFEGNALATVLERAGIADPAEITDAERQALMNSYRRANIVPGMEAVLRELAEENVLAVVTSTMIDVVTNRFEELGIADLFAAYLGPEAAVTKDKKVITAMQEFGRQTNHVYFITDTLGDLIEVRKVGGVKRVAVTWGFHDKTRLAFGMPDTFAETPEDIVRTVKLVT